MTRWSNGNLSVYTLADLAQLVADGLPVQVTGDPVIDLEKAVRSALLISLSDLRTVHYLDTVMNCDFQCEIDLSSMGISHVTHVDVRAKGDLGPNCWSNLAHWFVRGSTLVAPGIGNGSVVRIEFAESAPAYVLGTTLTLTAAYDSSVASPIIHANAGSPGRGVEGGRYPAAGYLMERTKGQVIEYVGRTLEGFSGNNPSIAFLNAQPPEWYGQTVNLPIGAVLEWAMPMQDMGVIELVRTAVYADYWAAKLLTCASDADRQEAMQLVVFWRGERERARRALKGRTPLRKTPTLRSRPADGTIAYAPCGAGEGC